MGILTIAGFRIWKLGAKDYNVDISTNNSQRQTVPIGQMHGARQLSKYDR
jgi:hypothetical protein